MNKSATFSVWGLEAGLPLSIKKLALFFHKIYIDRTTFDSAVAITKNEAMLSNEMFDFMVRPSRDILFLAEQSIVEVVEIPEVVIVGKNSLEVEKLNDGFDKILNEDFGKLSSKAFLNSLKQLHDIRTRINRFHLNELGLGEVIPILNGPLDYNEQAVKHEVVHLVLNKISMPSDEVSWEEIFDIRNDENLKLHYYELLDWINKTTLSGKSISDIEDEYMHLYYQYKRSYDLHNLKSSFTTLDLMVLSGIEAITSLKFGGLFSNLLKIKTEKIQLLQNELNLPGKQIAYIQKVENRIQ